MLARCTEVDSGAGNVDHILNGTPLPKIADHVLALMADAEAQPITRIGLSAAKDGRFKVKIV